MDSAKRLLILSLAMMGCTGETPGELGPFNFDHEIDGGGIDYNEPPETEPVLDKNDSYAPKMCVNKDGIVYVAWYEQKYLLNDDGDVVVGSDDEPKVDGFVDVWFTRSEDQGVSWAEPIRVKQGAGNASNIDMKCLGDKVYVVWEDTRDGKVSYQNIYMNFSTDRGDSWQNEDIPLDNDPEGLAISLGPRLSLYGDKVLVVWYDQAEGAPDVYVARSQNGGKKFDPPDNLSSRNPDPECDTEEGAALPKCECNDPGDCWNGKPQIAVDEDGAFYVLWESTKNGKQDLFMATSVDGKVFNPKRRIDKGDEEGENNSFAPQIGVTKDAAYVVWHDTRSGEHRDVYMNYSEDDGQTWFEEAVRVDSDAMGFAESLFPSLAVEGKTAQIVWQDARFGDDNTGYDIFYRVADAGQFTEGEAGAEVRLDTDPEGSGNSVYPKIQLNGGLPIVAWADYREDGGDGYNDLFYNMKAAPSEGADPEWLEEDLPLKSWPVGTSFTTDHQIAIFGDKLYTVWIDGRNGSRDVFFSQVVLGEGVENLTVYQQQSN